MKNVSLILRILAIVAAIAATTLYFISKGKLAEKHELLTRTQQVLTAAQSTLSETQKTLERTESELTTERDTLARTKTRLEGVQSELAEAEKLASRAQRELRDEREKSAKLETDSRQLRADLSDALEDLTAVKREENQRNQLIAELENTNAQLKLELEAKAAIADSVVARSVGSTPGQGSAVDRSDPSAQTAGARQMFIETIVNSISPADGLIALNTTPMLQFTQGQTITLLQGNKVVGKVQIQSVKTDYVVANILPGSTGTTKLASGSTVQILN